MEESSVKNRLRLLLDHFSRVGDPRKASGVKFPLNEVLFLVTCGTIAGCDDYDEIFAWGEQNLDWLRRHSEFYFGIPSEDWLRIIVNRIDPLLFEAVFMSWVQSMWPDNPDLIALDGKTLRRSGDSTTSTKALHLVSAWASTQRLVLCQQAVDSKQNECAAILTILERLSLKGALVTIDAIATNPKVARAILDHDGDYILALKKNQPTLYDEVESFFADPETTDVSSVETVEKDHGRIETRTTTVSHNVDWLIGDRRFPDEFRLPGIACVIRAVTQTECRGKVTSEIRYFISSTALSADRAAQAIRGHWGIESYHWSLDVTFKEDQSRLRKGHGAENMALVRRFAFNLVRAGKGKKSIKTARKAAGWNPAFLESILNQTPVNAC